MPSLRDKSIELSGGHRDESVSDHSMSSSVPSSILRAMQSTKLPDEFIQQTWATLEAMLDRKFDKFRQSIASQRGSTSSPVWSPESMAALASTLRDVLRESPRSRNNSRQTEASDDLHERRLLQAIQETQNMINGLKQQHCLEGENRSVVTSEEQISSVSLACPPSLPDSDLVEQIAKRFAEIFDHQISAETIIEQMVSRSEQQLEGQARLIISAR